MPKFIGTITRDDASDFKLVEGCDVKIRGTKDLTGVTLVDADLLLVDDVSVSSGDSDGTEDSTGRIQLSQLKTYVNAGTVDATGTPADNQIAVWTDADTLEGSAKLTFTTNDGLLIDNDVTVTADTSAQLKITGTTEGYNSGTPAANTAFCALIVPAFNTNAATDSYYGLNVDTPNIDVSDGALTNAYTLNIQGAPTEATNNYALNVGGFTVIDRNTSGDGAENATGLHVDFDRTVAGSGTAAHNDIGIDLDVTSRSLGTSTVIGMDVDVVGHTDGTHTATGIDLDVDGADTNIGMLINTAGTHLKLVANADAVNDYATIAVADTGDLTIRTFGNDTTDSDISLKADGDVITQPAGGNATWIDGSSVTIFDIDTVNKRFQVNNNADDYARFTVGTHGNLDILTVDASAFTNAHITLTSEGNTTIDATGGIFLDSATGAFVAKKAGTEFSATNSAYAGMILGYTDIGLNEGHASYNLTEDYEVPTAEFGVTFVVPPSENVLIEVQIMHNNGSSGVGDLYAGLSDADSYSPVASYHEKRLNDNQGRGGMDTIHVSWTLTADTLPNAGDSETIWVGFKAGSITGTPLIQWGADASGRYPDFIMKATALPATIST